MIMILLYTCTSIKPYGGIFILHQDLLYAQVEYFNTVFETKMLNWKVKDLVISRVVEY